jgi:cytochrome b pre-mRNA-processing protein 3
VFWRRMFQPRPARLAGRALYDAAVAQARSTAFYAALGVPDTPTGRFEIYTLHVVLLLHRLKGQGEQAAETAQGLFETYLQALDHALRELGVGDLSVGRKMRGLGEAFYGRAKSYDAALSRLPDREGLGDLVGRTIYADVPGRDVAPLVDYVVDCVDSLGAAPLEAVLETRLTWPSAGA